MRRLRTATFILIAALSSASPLAAQIVGRPQYERVSTPDPFLGNGYMPGPGVGSQLRDIDRRIDRARRSGYLTHRQARQLKARAHGIAYLAGVYRHGGVSRSERIELQARIDILRDTVNRRPTAEPASGRGR